MGNTEGVLSGGDQLVASEQVIAALWKMLPLAHGHACKAPHCQC